MGMRHNNPSVAVLPSAAFYALCYFWWSCGTSYTCLAVYFFTSLQCTPFWIRLNNEVHLSLQIVLHLSTRKLISQVKYFFSYKLLVLFWDEYCFCFVLNWSSRHRSGIRVWHSILTHNECKVVTFFSSPENSFLSLKIYPLLWFSIFNSIIYRLDIFI